MKKQFNLLTIVFIFYAVIVIGLTAGAIYSESMRFTLTVVRQMVFRETIDVRMNVLILGLDSSDEKFARSDSINILHFDTIDDRAGLLSIPRDTLVNIPGRGWDKINHAYAYGGLQLAKATVEEFIGHKIDHYVIFDLQDFMDVVDDMGGVEIDVEKRFYYTDRAGGLYIDLQPGKQTLKGYQAMGYCRFRHDDQSDWGRIVRQQKFFRAMADKMLQPQNMLKIPSIALALSKKINTDVPVESMFPLISEGKHIYDSGDVITGYIPGEDVFIGWGWFMKPYEEDTRKVIRVIFDGDTTVHPATVFPMRSDKDNK